MLLQLLLSPVLTGEVYHVLITCSVLEKLCVGYWASSLSSSEWSSECDLYIPIFWRYLSYSVLTYLIRVNDVSSTHQHSCSSACFINNFISGSLYIKTVINPFCAGENYWTCCCNLFYVISVICYQEGTKENSWVHLHLKLVSQHHRIPPVRILGGCQFDRLHLACVTAGPQYFSWDVFFYGSQTCDGTVTLLKSPLCINYVKQDPMTDCLTAQSIYLQ